MAFARPLLAASLIGLVAAHASLASAQQVFRIVGPDGKVTFSDKPPPEPAAAPGGKAAAAPTVQMSRAAAAADANSGALPFELRQIASRYPVTIYTGANCGPCNAGRSLLSSRGIPFTEKTVATREDIEALTRISGAASVPVATIGGQQLKGFSEVEWTQFLDAAGYPKTSRLPSGYRQAAASPLVVAQEQAAPAAAPAPAEASAAPTAPPPSGPSPSNPAGIRF